MKFQPDILKARRQRRGVVARWVADQLDIDRNTFARWEEGRTVPRADQLAEWCRLLGLTPSDVYGGPDDS